MKSRIPVICETCSKEFVATKKAHGWWPTCPKCGGTNLVPVDHRWTPPPEPICRAHKEGTS